MEISTADGKSSSTIPSLISADIKKRQTKEGLTVKENMLEFMRIKEMAEINEYRRQMNFPAEVEWTSTVNIGSGSSQATDEESSTTNKSNTYNRNSKRGTRLVRSR